MTPTQRAEAALRDACEKAKAGEAEHMGAVKALWRQGVLPKDEAGLLSVIAHLLAADQWMPIETAPKDGTEICAWVGKGYDGGWLQLSYCAGGGKLAWRDWDDDIWSPTHWMPLATPNSF